MTPWAQRVATPSTALQYIGDIILNLLLIMATALLMLSAVLFA